MGIAVHMAALMEGSLNRSRIVVGGIPHFWNHTMNWVEKSFKWLLGMAINMDPPSWLLHCDEIDESGILPRFLGGFLACGSTVFTIWESRVHCKPHKRMDSFPNK